MRTKKTLKLASYLVGACCCLTISAGLTFDIVCVPYASLDESLMIFFVFVVSLILMVKQKQ
jgi:hypothetical protein